MARSISQFAGLKFLDDDTQEPAGLIVVDQEWPNCIICGNQQIRFAQVQPCRTPSCEEQSGPSPAYGRF